MATKTDILTASLDKLSDKIINLKQKMSQMSEGSDKHLQATKRLNTALKEQAVALERVNNNSKSFVKGSARTGAAFEQTATSANKAEAAINKNIVAEKKQGNAVTRFTKAFSGRIGTLAKYLLATKLIQLGIQALSTLFITTTKRAIEFDGALGDLGAVTGESGDDLKAFGDVALRTAGATKLTATEVVALQKELAKLGTSSDDILKLTLPIAQLSQALGESGAEVAKIFKSITNQFGLTTNASVDLAGTILKTTTSSALNLNTLATGMGYVGTQASIMGLTVEETAANLAILADNGLAASKAGTGFRNVLIAATKSGKTYDEFIDGLAKKGLSAGDAFKLFGKRAAAAGLLLVRNREAVIKLTEGLNDNEAVLSATIQQMGSAKGVTEQLTSAWGNLLIEIGNGIAKSNLFIKALKLINKEAGLEAELLKGVKDGGKEVQDMYIGIARAADGFTGIDADKVIDIGAIEEKSATLAESLEQNESLFKSVRKRFEAQLRSGKIEEGTSFMDFLRLKEFNAGEPLYKDAWEQINYITAKGIEQGAILTQGNADDNANTLKNVKAFADEADKLSADARANRLSEKDVKDYGNRVEAEIVIAEKQLVIDKKIAKDLKELYDNDDSNDNNRRNFIRSNTVLEIQKAEVDALNAKRILVSNLSNDEVQLGKDREERFALSLDALKRERKAELDKLSLQQEVDGLAVKSEEERRDFEIRSAKEIGDLNDKYAGKLTDLIGLNEEATNIEGAKNLLQTWSLLGDISKKAVGQVASAIDGLEDSVADYIKEQDKLLTGGVIDDDTRNKRVADFQAEQKRLLKLFVKDLVETAGLSEEAAASIVSAVDGIDVTDTKVSAKGSILGKLLGIDPKTFIADSEKDAEKLFGAELEKVLEDALRSTFAELGDIYSEFNDVKFDNLNNELEAEIDAVKRRYDIEEDILKSSLDNQLITDSQFRVKSIELKKAQLAEENAIAKQIFDNDKKQDKQSAIAEGLESAAIATVGAFANSKGDFLTGALNAALLVSAIAGGTGARVAAIGNRKFFPKKFEDGGSVEGPSHAEGGVPFTVQGQGGYEMEGGEYIINKRSAAMHKDLLDRINSSGRTNATQGTRKFADGGEVIGSGADAGIEYLKIIAGATLGTANNTGKPMRAFVSSKDLKKDSRERSIRNNNNKV